MVMVAALALAGGACGGDDDGDVSDDAVVSTTASTGTADSSGTDPGDAVEVGYTESDENDDDDSGDDTADTVADESGDESSPDDGTLRDQTIVRLVGIGLTEVQAACITDNVPDLEEFVRTGESDPTAFLLLVEPCAIDLSLLTPPDPGG
jgi:hypothetical protein